MVSTCIETEFDGNTMPLFPPNVIILLVSCGINFSVRGFVYYVENMDAPPKPGQEKHTSYGFGARGIAKAMSSLGLAFSIPEIILWFVLKSLNDTNSNEFACQVQSGLSFVPPLIIAYLCFILWATNFMRIFTRHSFAGVILDHIKPVEDCCEDTDSKQKNSVIRIAVLPAYRGIWLSPIVQRFTQKYLANTTAVANNITSHQQPKTKQCEFVALDCYNSIYNPESDAWLSVNMKLEKIPPEMMKVLWTNFKHIDLPDNSLDSVVIPIGLLIPYLSQAMGTPGEESPEQKHKRAVDFFLELKRVMKPGGKLIGSNLFFYQSKWVKALTEAGFVDLETLKEKVWWTYLPATVSVAAKPLDSGEATGSGEIQQSASVVSPVHSGAVKVDSQKASTGGGNSSNHVSGSGVKADGSAVSAVSAVSSIACEDSLSIVSRPTGHSVLSFEVSSAAASEAEEQQRHRSVSLSGQTNMYVQSLNNVLCPAGANFRLIEFLLLVTLVAYVGFLAVTCTQLNQLQAPYIMPYDQQFSALFINNCLFIPVALFSMVGDLRQAASTGYAPHTSQHTGTTSPDREASLLAKQRKLIWTMYQGHVANILIVVTIVTGLGWVPYFVLDYLLIEYGHLTFDDIDTVNIVISITVVMVLIPVAQLLYKWYAKRQFIQSQQMQSLAAAGAGETAEEHNSGAESVV